MKNEKKNKIQLEEEKSNAAFVSNAEMLLEEMAMLDHYRHEFYDKLMALACRQECLPEESRFGIAVKVYSTNRNAPYAAFVGNGLLGAYEAFCAANGIVGENLRQMGGHLPENLECDYSELDELSMEDEIDNGYIRSAIDDFVNISNAFGRTIRESNDMSKWYNIDMAFWVNGEDVPEPQEFCRNGAECFGTGSFAYPSSMYKELLTSIESAIEEAVTDSAEDDYEDE